MKNNFEYKKMNNLVIITVEDGTMTIERPTRGGTLYSGTEIDWHAFLLGVKGAIGYVKPFNVIMIKDGTRTNELF